jgi:diacylglycerol kinase family enzyme
MTKPPPGRASPDEHILATPSERKRMLIIVNPYATTVSDRLRHLVVYALEGRYQVDAIDTQARGHATTLCRDAASAGYDVVVAFGGDGTVNEAVNGLAGSAVPLTCLPGGSANVYAKILGIPGDIVDATEHLLRLADHWHPRRVDVGQVNGRLFTFSSGVGLDASVVQRVDSNPRLKARLGSWYFMWAAVTTFNRRYLLRPPRMEVEVDGHVHRGVTTIVQNARPFTYFNNRPIDIADGASIDGGTLSGAVLHRGSAIDLPTVAVRAFLPTLKVTRHRRVSGFTDVRELVVRTTDGRPLPLQVDGDYLGEFPEARYGIIPGHLAVIS